MELDDKIHGLTTLIETRYENLQGQGTGFFFQEFSSKEEDKNEGWRTISSIWLITNRHVALMEISNQEIFPDFFIFNLRKKEGENIIWKPIILNKEEVRKRIRLSSDPSIDVVAIKVDDLIIDLIKSEKNIYNYYAVSEENLAGKNNIKVEVTDDVIVVGYPRNFYDTKNVFPIVKSGVVSTRWGFNFNGRPLFLIDSKLFPGSSGSIVISKPTDTALVNGKMLYNKSKQFAFLGVYSGEPYRKHSPLEFEDFTIIKKDNFNLGNVWYADTVIDIVKRGVTGLQTINIK